MHARRDEAIRMRLNGSSYGEIAAALDIGKGTLSYMLKAYPLSDEQRARLKRPKKEKPAEPGMTKPKRHIVTADGAKRYGPYRSNHGHLFFCDEYPDGRRKSVWVHREMMEKHLGRKLTDQEVVHHKSEIPDDNRIDNFEIKTPGQHTADHQPPAEKIRIVCLGCGNEALLFACVVRNNQGKLGKEGPFCGRSCAGKWNQRKQKTYRGGKKRA